MACTITALAVGFSVGGEADVAHTTPSTASATTAPSATVIPAPSAAEPVITGALVADGGASAGPVTGGTTVTVSGEDLGTVASVTFGGTPGTVVAVSDSSVTLTSPAAVELVEGTVPVALFDLAGDEVAVGEPSESASTASASDAVPLDQFASEAEAAAADPAAADSAAADAAAPAAVAPLTFSYTPDPHVTAQIDYVMAHWNNYNTAAFGAIAGNDCVNFTSQSLNARGWEMDGEWSYSAGGGYSSAWASSTAFAAYLAAHPERATALGEDQRAQVKVGDVVQFDWDSSGDRDHTGIVTRVDKSESGVAIYFAGHTKNGNYSSVDETLANAGGTVSYWSVK